MNENDLFYIQKGNIYAVPIIHYNMEMAAQVRLAFNHLQPDCVAVELAETMQLQLLHAASRLPDISVVITYDKNQAPLYYLSEPCDAAFEGLRSALEAQIPAYCIDLDVDYYPDMREVVPDPYAIQRIGLQEYFNCYEKVVHGNAIPPNEQDIAREMHMARKLKELSLRFDKILFVGGMSHIRRIMQLIDRDTFPESKHAERKLIEICTLTKESCRDVMAEYAWITNAYEACRENADFTPPDRQKLIFNLFKESGSKYSQNSGNPFPGYNLRNLMKFVRNYSLIQGQLMPDLFKLLSAAKGCVDHNYAYEVWELATEYSFLKNIDGLAEIDLSIEDIWSNSKLIQFHMKQPGRKGSQFHQRRRDKSRYKFHPPAGMFTICSYPPEDKIIENFGHFLKKKGTQLLTEEGSRSLPFSSSLEDGIDVRETLRHWYEKKLYVKMKGKPPGTVGSVVIIFDEDNAQDDQQEKEEYPWRTTWLGEHQQESDMAFYATEFGKNVVGPGISRSHYGGFMMSYPPRRLQDVWTDPDYEECRSKAEVLLMSAIDYAITPVVVYVAAKPPRSALKSFAQRYGKRIVYIPIGQLSPITINKLRVFHVLDGYDKRSIADEFIY